MEALGCESRRESYIVSNLDIGKATKYVMFGQASVLVCVRAFVCAYVRTRARLCVCERVSRWSRSRHNFLGGPYLILTASGVVESTPASASSTGASRRSAFLDGALLRPPIAVGR